MSFFQCGAYSYEPEDVHTLVKSSYLLSYCPSRSSIIHCLYTNLLADLFVVLSSDAAITAEAQSNWTQFYWQWKHGRIDHGWHHPHLMDDGNLYECGCFSVLKRWNWLSSVLGEKITLLIVLGNKCAIHNFTHGCENLSRYDHRSWQCHFKVLLLVENIWWVLSRCWRGCLNAVETTRHSKSTDKILWDNIQNVVGN